LEHRVSIRIGGSLGSGGFSQNAGLDGKRIFACPICAEPREVRITKKNKPYITCDLCGIQVFIRGPAGIAAFYRLVDRAEQSDLLTRLEEMERLYRLKCGKCGTRFWAEPEQIKTTLIDGSLRGFARPECGSTVEWRKQP
jgi:transcription elongation factor Elf1